PAVLHGDGKLGQGERRADVGGHVVRSLHGVAVEPVVLGHQAVEEGVEVMHHVRVGILLNGERGGGVLHEDGEQSGAHMGALQPGGDLPGDFVQTLAAGGDLKVVRGYLHGVKRMPHEWGHGSLERLRYVPYPWPGYSARKANEKTGWKSPKNTCHTSSRPIMLKAPSERPKCWMRRPRSSETSTPRAPKPSSGGTGIKLN